MSHAGKLAKQLLRSVQSKVPVTDGKADNVRADGFCHRTGSRVRTHYRVPTCQFSRRRLASLLFLSSNLHAIGHSFMTAIPKVAAQSKRHRKIISDTKSILCEFSCQVERPDDTLIS